MTTLTANAGQVSRAVEISDRATLEATLGYVEYTTASLVEARQGRAVWTTWPVGATPGIAYSLDPMVVRLVGQSNGATCQITDPRALMFADAFPRVNTSPDPLLWALDDGTLYRRGNVLAGSYLPT